MMAVGKQNLSKRDDLVILPGDARWAYRRKSIDRAVEAVIAMLRRKAPGAAKA